MLTRTVICVAIFMVFMALHPVPKAHAEGKFRAPMYPPSERSLAQYVCEHGLSNDKRRGVYCEKGMRPRRGR
jgi:hypothetical protein